MGPPRSNTLGSVPLGWSLSFLFPASRSCTPGAGPGVETHKTTPAQKTNAGHRARRTSELHDCIYQVDNDSVHDQLIRCSYVALRGAGGARIGGTKLMGPPPILPFDFLLSRLICRHCLPTPISNSLKDSTCRRSHILLTAKARYLVVPASYAGCQLAMAPNRTSKGSQLAHDLQGPEPCL